MKKRSQAEVMLNEALIIILIIVVLTVMTAIKALAATTAVTVTPQSSRVTVEQTGIIVAPETRTVSATVAPLTAVTAVIEVPGPQGIPGATTVGEGGGGTWGSIIGTLSDQTDLQAALNSIATTPGPKGYDGYDGRDIELQKSATHVQWRYVGGTTWTDLVLLSAITGAAGTNGTNGINGLDGKTVLNGSGAPGSGLGVNGDFYIDTAAANLYGPKSAGAWPEIYISLVGPVGATGPPGPAATVDSVSVRGALDDPIDGATVWVQQGATEAATAAKSGTKDRDGNAKQWIDANGTTVRQCITSDTAPAFKMLSPAGAVIYTVACDNTMTFSGTVTIK